MRLQEELGYEAAVRTLGFEPGAMVSAHLPAFRQIEARLCELIEATPDEERKARFREELARLNEALRVVEQGRDREAPSRRRGAGARLLFALVLVAVVVGAAWWANQRVLEERALHVRRQIEMLAVDGRIAVESRRWVEAEELYGKILALDPESRRGHDGLQSILEGKEAERRQQLGFLLGSAQAAIEQGNWEEAEATARELLGLEADYAEAADLLKLIEDGRRRDQITKLLEGAEEAVRGEQWEVLADKTAGLQGIAPDHPDLPRLRELTARGLRLMEERRQKARRLYQEAMALDDGSSYSQQAIDALREAIRLSSQPEYEALYRKISGYARILEVPGEFAYLLSA